MPAAVLQFVGSLAAVVAIVTVAWLLGSRKSANLSDEEEARELFRLAPGGFEPVEIALDTEGAAAIARDADGRLAMLVPHGNQFVFRLVPPDTPIRVEGDSVTPGNRPFLRITIGESARDWANTDSGDNNG